MSRNRIIALLILAASMLPAIAFAQSAVSIKIVKPIDRHNIELQPTTVTVEITGATLKDGYTWQLFVDGDPQGMVKDSLTTTVEVGEPSGPRRLKVELYDPHGLDVASNEILVMAAPVESNAPVFNRDWFAPFMGVVTVLIIAMVIIGLRIRPRQAT